MHASSDLLGLLMVFLLTLAIPGSLTVINIICCFKEKPILERVSACITILLGGFMYLLLFGAIYGLAGDWDEAIYDFEYHNVLSTKYLFSIFLPVLLGLIAYFWLLFNNSGKKPPLVESSAIALVLILNVIQIAVAIHIGKNAINDQPISYLYYVYHFNVLLLSVRVVTKRVREQLKSFDDREKELEQHENINTVYKTLKIICRLAFPILIALFAIVCVFEIIFLLTSQGLDAPIKAFTDTADWTFSQQIPPPPKEYDGHYLCTVAAGGHEKIVKPLRLGRRRGAIIVVNRQLSIANAFEEMIQERHPVFHRHIRHFYDTHGYPLSKLITTRTRADIVYFLMKPLEWIFLVYLYLTDPRPEVRINRQYHL